MIGGDVPFWQAEMDSGLIRSSTIWMIIAPTIYYIKQYGDNIYDDDYDKSVIIITFFSGCTQIPISTLSHIWVFVRLYGIVFVIIVIIVIIIVMIIKSEGVNAQL